MGNRDSMLKGLTQNLTHYETQDSNLKGGWVRSTCRSCKSSQKDRKQLELTLGTYALATTISGTFPIMRALVLTNTILKS